MPPLSHAERTRLSNNLQRISKIVERELRRSLGRNDVGFSLIVWGAIGEDHMIQYISNVHREDVMREMLALLKGWAEGMPDIPFHERQ